MNDAHLYLFLFIMAMLFSLTLIIQNKRIRKDLGKAIKIIDAQNYALQGIHDIMDVAADSEIDVAIALTDLAQTIKDISNEQ